MVRTAVSTQSDFSSIGDNHGTAPEQHSTGSWAGADESDDELQTMAPSNKRNGVLCVNSSEEMPVYNMDNMYSHHSEDVIRRKLRFFFMNPIEKWQAKRRFPYKLAIQLMKVILVTVQLCLFASYRYDHENYNTGSKVSFSHLFVKNWDSAREVNAYPPTNGPLAVYTKDAFYGYLDFAVNSYTVIPSMSIGSYIYTGQNGTISPMKLCVQHYKQGIIYNNSSYIIDSRVETDCLSIDTGSLYETHFSDKNFSMYNYLKEHNFTVAMDATIAVELIFSLRTVSFRDVGPSKSPDCYLFDISLAFDNRVHNGQMLMFLNVEPIREVCHGRVEYIDSYAAGIRSTVLNILVILACALSFILCCRAIGRAQTLKWKTRQFFKRHFGKDLTLSDRLDFLNFWYVLMIVDDVFIIIGSAVKQRIESEQTLDEVWDLASVLIGIGNLLVWFGILRYLGFFQTYNVLILTMKRASPNVLRFIFCAVLIYLGFVFCGWLVLGPYHMKFSSLSSTSECLFSLINGDDMFATFDEMSRLSTMLWWFSRLYLYVFISLFIYVVLSLFIAVIMDAYETIKLYYADGFPKSDLHEFIAQCNLPADSNEFRCQRKSTWSSALDWFLGCTWFHKEIPVTKEEIEPLLP